MVELNKGIILGNQEKVVEPRLSAQKLEEHLNQMQQTLIAYSGGVDSALLAYAANKVLGERMLAVMADSASLSRREYRNAIRFTQTHGIPLQIIRTRELEDPSYQANQADRCYHCKKTLFEKIEGLRQQLQGSRHTESWQISYGGNVDDLGDYRPGMQAAREASIQAPYLELGFNKQIIRDVCTFYNLEIADKPAMPCMASRIAYGEKVTPEKLDQVERAEDFLYDLGLRVLRVRHHGDTARIEVPPSDFETISTHRKELCQKFRALGFIYVALDLDGFKSGSLNSVLKST
jgi:pyridinium-3,5-biscarboxylic acid mononucleotide sulfurtransferase